MIQVICSECSSELDIDTTQHGSSIELSVSPCSCMLAHSEELDNQIEAITAKAEEYKEQVSLLEDKVEELSNNLTECNERLSDLES